MAITPKRLAGGTLTNAMATYYTAGAGVRTRVEAFSVVNYSAAAQTMTVHIVPTGGTADNTNIVAKDVSLAPSQRGRIFEMIGQWIESGGTIQAIASAGSALTITASGIEQTTIS